jgi:hemerythrin-like domain-containing protein
MEIHMSTRPVSLSLFEFLDSTHRDIQTHLGILREVVAAVEDTGLTPGAREKARVVLAFFNGEARQHHLDEEKHVFPALLASQNPELEAATRRLIQDHGWLEENWLYIEPSIAAASEGNQWFDPMELIHALDVFEALYADHLLLEESLAYPEARQRLAAWDQAGMGREMAQRRHRRQPVIEGA